MTKVWGPGEFVLASDINGNFAGKADSSQTATGATALRPLPNILGDVFNVKNFGALGNGTDATTAFQAALTAASAVGGMVEVPAGTYIISASLVIAGSNVSIIGTGVYSSIIRVSSHSFDIFSITAAAQVRIANLYVIADGVTATERFVINDTNSCSLLDIRHLLISGAFSGIRISGALFNANDVTMLNIAAGVGSGFVIDQASGEVCNIRSCYVQNAPGANARAGVLALRASCLCIQNTQFVKCGNPIWVSPASGRVIYSLKFLGVWCDTSSGNGIFLDGTAGLIVRVDIRGCWMSSNAYGVRIAGVVEGAKISGCEIFGNTTEGISVLTGATVNGLLIEGNHIAGNVAAAAIDIGAGVSQFTIANNVCGPCADFGANGTGIVVNAGASDDYVIVGNRCRGNTGAALTDGGTGTHKQVTANVT